MQAWASLVEDQKNMLMNQVGVSTSKDWPTAL